MAYVVVGTRLPGAVIEDASLPGYPAKFPPDPLYDALPTPLSFRLIEIITVFPRLSCKMKTVSLTDHTPYQALSYCWGSPNRSVTLWCNGFKLKISPNLAKGLKRLYAYAVRADVKSFWVDQICIHQEDNAERTQQVRMMRSIYQRSTHTIIWLPLKNSECPHRTATKRCPNVGSMQHDRYADSDVAY